MKRFVTLFEKTENFHLIKDVGQIPYLMHCYYGYDSMIVTYKNNNIYPYLEKEVKGLKLKFIPKVKFGRYSISILVYLFFNATKIDILHLFHHREKTYLNFLMYKWRNPNGVAFLKSDMGLDSILEYDGLIDQKRSKYMLRKWLFERVFPVLDIISIETEEGYTYLCNRYPRNEKKFLFMPNGLNLERMYALVQPRKFEEKEDVILTVGRIGAPEKNNEMLLDAIQEMTLGDWKVVFIGPIEKGFEHNIKEFFQKNPHLREKVVFTGEITNRQTLFEWYAKSKIFCLTSIQESFGLVLIEAMAYANYVVTTSISSANEITNFQQTGKIITDEEELICTLYELMKDSAVLQSVGAIAARRARERYSWVTILQSLNT